MPFEVELKYPVDSIEEFALRLIALNARPEPMVTQVDRYFNHPSRDFGETDEALRIRTIASTNELTWKGPKIDPVAKTREELEVSFDEGPAGQHSLATILKRLGFRETLTVQKSRTVWHAIFDGQAIEVCVDIVENLGSFVELECIAEEKDLESTKNRVLEFADCLKLEISERRSYLELLIEQRESTE